MADDSTLCRVCRGSGTYERVDPVGHVIRATCWRCSGSGKFVKREDAWPYRREVRG